MINNQISSPIHEKNFAGPGQSGVDGKQGNSSQKSGLFKLLMSSVQTGDLSGNSEKKGDASSNILGGNLTLSSQNEEGDEPSVLRILAGSDEGSKEEKIALSKLLEGQDATVESDNEVKDEAASDGKQVTGETSDSTDTEESNKPENSDGLSTQPDVPDESDAAVHDEQTTADSSVLKEADNGIEAGTSDNSGSGENSSTTVQRDAAVQSAAVTAAGENGAGKTAGSQSSEQPAAKPLINLVVDGESGLKEKTTGAGQILPGDKVLSTDGAAKAAGLENKAEGNGFSKTEGLVNELRAFAAARGERLPTVANESNLRAEESNDQAGAEGMDEGELLQNIFSALQTGSIEQAAAEIRSLKASQMRETRFSNYMASFANRQEISVEGSALDSGSATLSGASTATLSAMPATAMVPTGASVSSELFDENGAVLWKEQITEYFESNEKSSSENQAAAAFARLGEIPVTNISVRKSFAQGISQAILSSTGKGNKGSEVWQKHNFILEDGKNIQVSARQVEGVLQLKLSSSYTELNKLLMEHEHDIRDLLENELELKIDLQMDGGGEGQLANFMGGSSERQSGRGDSMDLGSLKTKEQPVEEVVPKAVRKFGYNQMEWTV